jgi:hypothetical protein
LTGIEPAEPLSTSFSVCVAFDWRLALCRVKKHGKIDIPRLLIQEGLKSYPGYCVALSYYVGRALIRGLGVSDQSIASLIFIQNCLKGETGDSAMRHPFVMLPLLAAVTLAAILAIRVANGMSTRHQNKTYLFATHLRLDGLLLGVLLSYLTHFRMAFLRRFIQGHRALLMTMSAPLLVPSMVIEMKTFPMYTFGLTANYLGFGGLLTLTTPMLQPPSPDGEERDLRTRRLCSPMTALGSLLA